MKITAAVMYEQGLPKPFEQSQPFRIEEVDLDSPGPGEVLVEIRAAGLCHSDLSQVKGLRKRQLPVVGGHEAAGIVRETGAGVTHLSEGDHVVMTVVSGCGVCAHCRRDRPALCQSVTAPRTKGLLANGQRRLSRNGAPIYHYSGISGFAEYAVTMPGSLVKIDPQIPLDVAALFGCAVVTGAGSVFNTAQVPSGASVAIIGLGGIGLNGLMAARVAGAKTIIGIDMRDDKFPIARELGATDTLRADDPELVEKVRVLTGDGVDFAFEMSGAPAAMKSAPDLIRPGGDVICVGLGASDARYDFVHATLVSQERNIRGSFMGSCVPERDIPHYMKLFTEGQMPVDRLRSSAIGFDQLNASLDRLDSGDVIRQVLLPHGTL
ncbi:zinc-binding dehydrogenase [Oricola sp.]|uniref:zinc-binding dehydrogenase n=1 Tax=Oricola sp. TaxID=1979950 RepID=UPI0025DAC512|nr:zinc-binding dehydrogenase [Oricola sp.]MCI5075388.1 alcohol dehydrogenase catalytic domain-containing protein [Oricola sp.]